MNYLPPYNEKQIRKKFSADLADKLLSDPVHKWRAETGIELIHREPNKKELERIWDNFSKMTQEQKEISDKKSLEFFGLTNAEHYSKIVNER